MILEPGIVERDDGDFAVDPNPWKRREVNLYRWRFECEDYCRKRKEFTSEAEARRTVRIAAAGLTGLEYSAENWVQAWIDLREELERDTRQNGFLNGNWIFSEWVLAALAYAEHLAAETQGD